MRNKPVYDPWALPDSSSSDVSDSSSAASIEDQLQQIRQSQSPPVLQESKPVQTRRKKWMMWTVVVCSVLSLFLGYGWANTDYDENGNAYILPLELHFEREYVLQSDQVLDCIEARHKQFCQDAKGLQEQPVYAGARLETYSNELLEKSNTLARNTRVPEKYKTYHDALINFCLNLRTFIQNLQENSTGSVEAYTEFVQSGLQDYQDRLQALEDLRAQIGLDVYRNVYPDLVQDLSLSSTWDSSLDTSSSDTSSSDTSSSYESSQSEKQTSKQSGLENEKGESTD